MPRKRIHELAIEWGMETRQLLARLEELGVHGKKAASILTDREIALLRPGVGPQMAVLQALGEERLVAERTVTEMDQKGGHMATAREEVWESYIRHDVVRRRVTRFEILPEEEVAVPKSAGKPQLASQKLAAQPNPERIRREVEERAVKMPIYATLQDLERIYLQEALFQEEIVTGSRDFGSPVTKLANLLETRLTAAFHRQVKEKCAEFGIDLRLGETLRIETFLKFLKKGVDTGIPFKKGEKKQLQDDLEALKKLRARATHSSVKRLGRRDYEHFKTILFGAEGDGAGLLGIVQALQDRMGS